MERTVRLENTFPGVISFKQTSLGVSLPRASDPAIDGLISRSR